MNHKTQILLLFALATAFSAFGQSGSPYFTYVDSVFCQNEPDPMPIVLNGTGTTFSATAGLVISPTTGEIDLSASLSGNHTITLSLTNPNVSLSLNLLLNPSDDATFTYPGTICENGQNPLPTITLPGGVFSGPVSFADSSTGEIALQSTVPGSYLVQYRTSGTCPDSVSAIVTINPEADATFLYPDTMYCAWPGFAHPQIIGQGGGVFTCSDPGLVLDSTDGRVNLPASNYGTFWVDYRTTGICPDTHRAVIGVAPPAFSEFQYIPDRFCQSDPNPLPIVTGDTNGVFSIAYGNVSIHPQTGEIDLQNSTPSDSILIKYVAPGYLWGCPDSMVQRIRLYAPDPTISITYNDTAYCQSATDPTPTINGPSGGVFQSIPGGMQFTNLQTGQIDLSATPPGTYEVRYFPPGSCADTSGGFQVRIYGSDQIGVYYAETERCQGAMPLAPVGLPNGSFFANDSGLVFADSTLGIIVPALSEAGAYLIGYQTSGHCPADTVFPFTILDSPTPEFIAPTSDQIICSGDLVDLLVFGGDRFLFSKNGNPVQALSVQNTYSPQVPPIDGDTFTVLALNTNGCEGRDTLILKINSRPQIEAIEAPEIVTERSGDLEIFFTVNMDSSIVHWTRTATGPVWPREAEGETPLLRQGSLWRINDTLNIQAQSPGIATYHLWAESNSCPGLMDSLEIKVLPDNDPIFIPGAITPDGNGQNDVWEIYTSGEVNPDDYRIEVFNRWGGKVYEQTGLYRGWNGGNLPGGTYWYVVSDLSGEVVKRDGVMIKRK